LPQWQIDVMRRLEIPDMREKYGLAALKKEYAPATAAPELALRLRPYRAKREFSIKVNFSS
jgi:hypothetical protein